ncbi:hypothetical protein IJ670_02825 [bacterium]|nr:hypothetical protein [bacterium]
MAGIEKLVTNGIQVASTALQKSNGLIQSATKPIEAGSEKLTETLSALATSNSALVKKTLIPQLVDETIELLNSYTRKPLNQDLSNLSPKNMVLVHMSDYYPQEGKILCARSFGKTPDGLSKPRTSIHFTVNNISSELFGDPIWAEKKFGIILPADKIFQQNDNTRLLGGVPNDFMIHGDVAIPHGSFIVKYNAGIPEGKLQIAESTKFDGIRIIETSNEDMNTVIPAIIKKMGYSTIETNSYSTEKMKNWKSFLDKYGLSLDIHASSPWGRAEGLIDYIGFLKAGEDSWKYSISSDFFEAMMKKCNFINTSYFNKNGEKYDFDYKKCFLDAIKQIKQELPKEKISYDIDKLSEIIRESETPSLAMNKIKSILKLIPMRSDADLSETPSIFTFTTAIDKFVVMGSENGRKAHFQELCIS